MIWQPAFVLNAILDGEVAAARGWSLGDLAEAFLAGGARFLQLRLKQAPGGAFLDAAAAVAERAHAAGAILLVNDRPDIARLAGADGVHVGQDDISPRGCRVVLGDQAIIGMSTHDEPELDRALGEPVSYVATGPVYATATKDTGYDAVGLAEVRRVAGMARPRGLPVVAIGGITLERAQTVLDAGADSVAVISDLLSTGDPETRVREYLSRLVTKNAQARV